MCYAPPKQFGSCSSILNTNQRSYDNVLDIVKDSICDFSTTFRGNMKFPDCKGNLHHARLTVSVFLLNRIVGEMHVNFRHILSFLAVLGDTKSRKSVSYNQATKESTMSPEHKFSCHISYHPQDADSQCISAQRKTDPSFDIMF